MMPHVRKRGIISDKICSKTNKNNQGQVSNLSEQVIAMGPGNEFTPKFKMDAHEDTKKKYMRTKI